MSVTTQNKKYSENYNVWKTIRCCLDGSNAIKRENTYFLPNPDELNFDAKRYRDYLMRANFEGITAKTLYALVGNVFRKPIFTELPNDLEYLNSNADAKGNDLDSVCRQVFKEIISLGRVGVLVDFPYSEEDLTLAQVQSQEYKAKISVYIAENIVNWCTRIINSSEVLDLVVLKEYVTICSNESEFIKTDRERYRVLKLTDQNIYVQEIWDLIDENKNEFAITETITPKNAKGLPFRYIPFVFGGSYNNIPDVNKAPLEDLSNLDVSLYRNSADLEEMIYLMGQPTLVLTGLTQNWITDTLQNKATLGIRTPIFLPENSTAQILQVNPNPFLQEAMKEKRRTMISLGARIILDKNQPEAAEAIRLKQSGESSLLATAVMNTEDLMMTAIDFCSDFMIGEIEESKVDINKDFINLRLTPDEIRSLISLWQTGVISLPILRNRLRDGEIINEDLIDEDIDAEIDRFKETFTQETYIEE